MMTAGKQKEKEIEKIEENKVKIISWRLNKI